MQTFLLADSFEHADILDHLIMERLRDVDGAKGSSWSGVYTDGTRYGVLWASPASDLFGVPITEDPENGDPSVVLAVATVDETGESNWYLVPPPEPDATDTP